MEKRFLRYWTYFRRGHSVYLIFAVSFLNFVVIQWRLLFEYIPSLEKLFQHFWIFTVIVVLVYFPLATIIGWIDYKRAAFPVDATIAAKANPWAQDLATAITLLAEGKNEEVVALMRKWTEK